MSVPTHDGHGRELLSTDQLAQRLGRSRQWVYRQRERGMPAIQLGRALVYEATAVDRWFASHRVGDWPDEEAA